MAVITETAVSGVRLMLAVVDGQTSAVVDFQTEDASGTVVRRLVVDITGQLTAAQRTEVATWVNRALSKAKAHAQIVGP